jgi:hypothetical protein
MMLTIRAGSVTLVEQHVGSEPGEISVRYVVPFFLRWLPVGVVVKVNAGNQQMAISATT